MAGYRIPGPLGLPSTERGAVDAAYKTLTDMRNRFRPGPLGCYSLDLDPTQTEEEEDRIKSAPEFALLNRFSIKGVDPGKGQHFRDLDDYIAFRNAFFGSALAYWEFARESDRDLDDHPILKRRLDNPWKKKKLKGKTLQTEGYLVRDALARAVGGPTFTVYKNSYYWYYCFYRWVRKAYLNKKTPANKIAEIVSSGMKPELYNKILSVRVKLTVVDPESADFKVGGFNPRPMKGPYRLGTISDHAFGTAADIEDDKNPNLSRQTWQKLKDFAGKPHIDRTPGRWKSNPKGLWDDIYDLNQKVVAKINAGAATEWNRVQIGRAAGSKDSRSEAEVKADYKEAEGKRLGLDPKLFDGFFSLDWDLVRLFHEDGFSWGATFSNTVDLHHFKP